MANIAKSKRLTAREVEKLRADYRTGTYSNTNLAAMYGVSQDTVTKKCKGIEIDEGMNHMVDKVLADTIENQLQTEEYGLSAVERTAVLNAVKRETSFVVLLQDEMYANVMMASDTIKRLHQEGEAKMRDYAQYQEILARTHESSGFRSLVEIAKEVNQEGDGDDMPKIKISFE